HLDLKPENVMITLSGKVKICDFGIARQLPAEDGQADDAHWSFAGTPAYMAPEVIQSSRFDARADVFSLGVFFYEMLTRARPFRSDTVKNTLNRIVHEPLSTGLLLSRGISRRLLHLITRMTAKDPADRPSAEDVIQELKSIKGRSPIMRV